MADSEEMRSALDAIDPAALDYADWLKAGQALKELGAPCSLWDAWSARDPGRYRAAGPDSCAAKWRTFRKGGGITGEWLFKVALNAGWKMPPDMSARLDFGTSRRAGKTLPPTPPDLTPAQQAAAQIRALFQPGEYVCIVTKAKPRRDGSGKWEPAEKGVCKKASEWLSLLDGADLLGGGLGAALGDSYNPQAGAWLCPNPTNGKGHRNADIAAHRFALVESDEVPQAQQVELCQRLDLPIATLTDTGGKSVHAVVRVDAEGPNHYRERVGRLFAACDAEGLAVDTANKNPGRLCRLAGAQRGDGVQRLLCADGMGAPSFDSWEYGRAKASGQETKATGADSRPLPPFGVLDVNDLPPLAPELIRGLLRRGHSLTLTADSKAGKTWALIELGLALACGGTWFGHECEQCRVLYVDFELDPPSFFKRVAWVAERMGYDSDTVKANFVPWNLRGYAAGLNRLEGQIVARIERGSFGCIILDPLYKCMEGDENSANDARVFVNAVDRVSLESGRAAMVYSHHHAKGTTSDRKGIERGSGSGVFGRYPDAAIDLMELKPGEGWLADHPRQAARFEDAAAPLSAWRAECVLREFPSKTFDLFFQVPLHVPDHMGELEGLSPTSPAQLGGRRGGQAAKAKQADRDGALKAALEGMLAGSPGGIPFASVVEADGRSPKRVTEAVSRLPGWEKTREGNAWFVKPVPAANAAGQATEKTPGRDEDL
ncbi:MAG: AAA family ATPase [Coriobacteriia bacterium]|nr:AAA family ATPase [Coriobacteriia bacterium]